METEDNTFAELDFMFQKTLELEKSEPIKPPIEPIEITKEVVKKTTLEELEDIILNKDFDFSSPSKLDLYKIYILNNRTDTKIKSLILLLICRILNDMGYDYEILLNPELQFKRDVQRQLEIYNSNSNFDLLNNINFSVQTNQNYHKGSSNNVNILLKFKNKVIKNSVGLTHTMPEIIFNLPFNLYSFTTDSRSTVIRSVLTSSEVISNYNFSHTNGDYNRFDNDLCYGSSDTEINKSINLFNNFYNAASSYWSRSFISLFSVFLNIDTYLSWESLEGTPYKYIKNIKSSNIAISSENNVKAYDYSNYNIIMNSIRNTVSVEENFKNFKNLFTIIKSKDLNNNDVIKAKLLNEEYFYELCETKPKIIPIGNNNYITSYPQDRNSANVTFNPKSIYKDKEGKQVYTSMIFSFSVKEDKVITERLKSLIENKVTNSINKFIYGKYIKKNEK